MVVPKEEQATTTLNIGYQKYGILPILKARGDLEKALKEQGVQVKWVEFPAGPQLLEGLNVGSVSLGEAGEAPPIFAQAANPNLVYVANQPAAPKAEALLVQKDSPIQSIKDLKGKRVALNKGSNVHYLLLKVLEANNLSLSDIQPVYLPPSDARAAFEKGAVDAWVIWDPFFAAAEHQIQARVLATGENLVSNHQFYLADRKFVESNPKVLNTVVQTLNQTTEWVSSHQDEAAKLLENLPHLSLMYSKLPFHVWVLEFSQSLTRWHKNNNKWLMLLCTKAHSKQTHHSRCHFKTEINLAWARLK